MPFPIPDFHPKPVSDPPALVRTATREDVLWNRPIFKAPPLDAFLGDFDASVFAEELRQLGTGFVNR